MAAHRIEWNAEPIRYELPGFRWAPFSVPCAGINSRHVRVVVLIICWLLVADSMLATEVVGQDGMLVIVAGRPPSQEQLKHAKRVVFKDRHWTDDPPHTISDRDLEAIRGASQIETVKLTSSAVTAEGCDVLAELEGLKRLVWFKMKGAREKLNVLARSSELAELVLIRSDLTDQDAEAVSQLKGLTYLNLTGSRVGTAFFETFQSPAGLTHLRLDNTRVDSQVIELLPVGLTHLSLVSTQVDDSAVPAIGRLDKLKLLEISLSKLSQQAEKRLKRELPKTRIEESVFGTLF